jgi:hypothetical protein
MVFILLSSVASRPGSETASRLRVGTDGLIPPWKLFSWIAPPILDFQAGGAVDVVGEVLLELSRAGAVATAAERTAVLADRMPSDALLVSGEGAHAQYLARSPMRTTLGLLRIDLSLNARCLMSQYS